MRGHKNSLYLQGHDNIRFLTRTDDSCRNTNHYMYKLIGIRKHVIISFLDILSPFLYILNVVFSLSYFVFKFLSGIVLYRRKPLIEVADIDTIYLFFFNHFIDRCKCANLYDRSRYYVLMPSIDKKFVNIHEKTIIDYKAYLNSADSFSIFFRSLSCLSEYVLKERTHCLVHKAWEFYELQVALEKIAKNSSLVFCNQSDKWALLFDNINSKKKILMQHGVASKWGKTPYRLSHVDIFYSMTQSTWQDAYKTILDCQPELRFMQPTINLFDTCSDSFNVLIISDIIQFEIEKRIVETLFEYKDLKIFVKKHPSLINDECYKSLQKEYDFTYITDNRFPKVDFVISYYSTLAYEYMAYDIPVYMYNDVNDFSMNGLLDSLNTVKDGRTITENSH